MPESKPENQSSRSRTALFATITVAVSVFVALVIGEIILRVAPIPGVRFNVSKANLVTGSGYYPGSTNYYRNSRGDFVRKKINRYGYLDREYVPEKPPGTVRVGFFGDSYTAAAQVPLEETFHRLVEDQLRTDGIEVLSFGVSGFSTYQSFLTAQQWADHFDLDTIAYVFVENDLGDQIEAVKKSSMLPYPLLVDGRIEVDDSYEDKIRSRETLFFRVSDYVTANSLILATLSDRIDLLRRYGITMSAPPKEGVMAGNPEPGPPVTRYPPDLNQNDPPSLWPSDLRAEAMALGAAVISNWRAETERQGRRFVILYTPRDNHTAVDKQDSWKPWLIELVRREGITFVDPTPELRQLEADGREVFYDHYTKYGHIGAASAFIRWWRESPQ